MFIKALSWADKVTMVYETLIFVDHYLFHMYKSSLLIEFLSAHLFAAISLLRPTTLGMGFSKTVKCLEPPIECVKILLLVIM